MAASQQSMLDATSTFFRHKHEVADLETQLPGVLVLHPSHDFGCSSFTQTNLHDRRPHSIIVTVSKQRSTASDVCFGECILISKQQRAYH